ncbi:MAG: hypothetical protein OXQ29_17905 [Rhodospirillaceae bacterium]|nr:hypothetical protein [Rhodospirillaceae bacterium]
MDPFVVHQPLLFKQNTTCIRGVILYSAWSGMAGCVHPAMTNVIAVASTVSSTSIAA